MTGKWTYDGKEKEKKYKIEFGMKQIERFMDVMFVSGLALICSALFFGIALIINLIFTGFTVRNYELIGFYMVFQIAFTFLYVNKNIKFDWGF